MKIGVYIATHNNPLFLRMALLQVLGQTFKPHVIAVFENGHPKSYWWAVKDLEKTATDMGIKVLHHHVEKSVAPAFHYRPLARLIAEGCDIFFKLDHDDFFYATHIEQRLNNLRDNDYCMNTTAEVLILPYRADYKYTEAESFQANPMGAMSDSICFNRKFAVAYAAAMHNEMMLDSGKVDDVVMYELLPKFKGLKYFGTATTCYVSHGANSSTADWAEDERIRQVKSTESA